MSSSLRSCHHITSNKAPVRQPSSDSDDDDDVPLARAIPTALQAQKSIRVSSRSRALSTGRRPRTTTDKAPPPVPRDTSIDYLRASERLVTSPPVTPGGAGAELPDEITRRLQALQYSSTPSKAQQESSKSPSTGLPRREPSSRHPTNTNKLEIPSRAHATASGDHSFASGSSSPSPSPFSHNDAPTRAATQRRAPQPSPGVRPEPSRAQSQGGAVAGYTRARALTLEAGRKPASANTVSPAAAAAPKTRPPSWIDFPELDFSSSNASKAKAAAAPPPANQLPSQQIQQQQQQQQPVMRQPTQRSKSRPPSPEGRQHGFNRDRARSQSRPSLPNAHQNSSGSLPPPYSSPLTSPRAAAPPPLPPFSATIDPPTPGPAAGTADWASPVPLTTGAAAYTADVLAQNADTDLGEDQRIFVENKQKYVRVRIGVGTRARDVLNRVRASGQLQGPNSDERAIGGWMLYEMAVDFGMERPVREYELISDVFATWNHEARVNYLMIKRSGLKGSLSFKVRICYS